MIILVIIQLIVLIGLCWVGDVHGKLYRWATTYEAVINNKLYSTAKAKNIHGYYYVTEKGNFFYVDVCGRIHVISNASMKQNLLQLQTYNLKEKDRLAVNEVLFKYFGINTEPVTEA